MGNIYLFAGRLSPLPYIIKDEGIKIYCLQELCAYIEEAAGVISSDFMCDELAFFLRDGCSLDKLSAKLLSYGKNKAKLSIYLKEILSAAGYYSEREIERLSELARAGEGFSVFEKRKVRADYFINKGLFENAISIYISLIDSLEAKDLRLGQLYHNCGSAYAGLLNYKASADYFKKAYELLGRNESQSGFYMAKRLELGEKDYFEYCIQNSLPPSALSCNEKLETVCSSWLRSPQYLTLSELKRAKNPKEIWNKIADIKKDNR